MFFEQYSHEPCIAVARAILRYQPPDSPRRAELPKLRERGAKALGVMQQQLAASDYIAGSTYTIADIALYAYTHCAADGGFELARYPALLAWLMRVKSQPGHVPLG
jgi:glutathione S-transferase